MKNVLSPSLAGKLLLSIFGLLFVFHLLVLARIIPYDIVWAGKITSEQELVQLESISLLVLVVAAVIIALKLKYLNFLQYPILINMGVWMLFALFLLNTIGNLMAKSPIEKYGFGLLTLVIALLALRLAISKNE